MSIIESILGASASKPTQAKIGNLTIDVVEAHEVKYDSEVTENPVEDGFPVADHVNRKPITLQLDVVFTPTPVTFSSGLSGLGTVLTYVGAGGSGSNDGNRLNTVKDSLYKIYKKGDPITITLADGIYKDMVMTSAPLPRNVQNGICYKMQLNFVQVRIVSQKTENVGDDASEMSGDTEQDAGAADQEDIGDGMNEDGDIDVDTTSVDYSNAGDTDAGSEITAETAASSLNASIVP